MNTKMQPRLSIITAIHNARAMNELYWEALAANTLTPFELIVVDNHSTDGSGEFFAQLASLGRVGNGEVIYLRNERNQSYPASQNQGLRAARADILCFLNNDIWMPRGWHEVFERALAANPLQLLSPSGQEAQPSQKASDQLKRRWRRWQSASLLAQKLLGWSEKERLQRSLRWMYGDLRNFQSPTRAQAGQSFAGIKGDSVIFHRALLARVPGIWDERFQAADWHLYLSIASEHEKDPSLPLPQVLCDAYIHHFGRYTVKRDDIEDFWSSAKFRDIASHWGEQTVARLWWGNSLPAK